jgi:hypothetical protein
MTSGAIRVPARPTDEILATALPARRIRHLRIRTLRQEYRYYLPDGEIYAAPMMILHYVEEHGYRPPGELRDGLRAAGQPRWDWRAERLHAVLLDQSADPDFRCQAAVDLANWNDLRALDALRCAAHDEDLADVAGDEIGRSLAAFVDRGRHGRPPAISASLRRMQNSLPSGSASTTHPVPSALRRSATTAAPSSVSRASSASRVPSTGRKSRWILFLICFTSGTSMKSRRCRPSRE